MRVKVKSGPLRGLEGWVEQRYGMTTVLLRLDFIGQAAAVKLQADCKRRLKSAAGGARKVLHPPGKEDWI
jgi:hypothetical protein